MNYKKIMGYDKKKKVIKENKVPKKNTVLDNVKKELNESGLAFGIQTLKDNPPFKTPKQMNEGPAFEYGKHIKNIQKAQNMMEKSVLALKKDLLKKGHKQEGIIISAGFYQFAEDKFNKVLKSIMDTLS